jgi:hypothetical protein
MDRTYAAFGRLSEILTGFEGLDPRMIASFATRLAGATFHADFNRLLCRFAEIEAANALHDVPQALNDLMASDAVLRSVAQQIIYLWYLSAELDGAAWRFGSPEEYSGALLWRAIGAHPPALSGGYMGHWRYPPGNLE